MRNIPPIYPDGRDPVRIEYHPSRRRYMTRARAMQSVQIWRRLLSGAIDLGVYAICVTLWAYLIAYASGYSPDSTNEEYAPPDSLTYAATVSGWIIFGVLVDMGITLWFKRTLGKTIMGLMIVDARPDRWLVSTHQIVKRTLFKAAYFYGFGVGTALIFDHFVWDGSFVYVFVALSALLTILLFGIGRDDQRGLHDRAAGTEVLRS